MAIFSRSLPAPLRPIMMLTALTAATLSSGSASAATRSFAAHCEALMDNSVQGLAIERSYSNAQLCACARTSGELRWQLEASGISCPSNQNRNFNQPLTTTSVTPDPDPGPDPGPDPDDPARKGNNGWGNGGEGINAGSDQGNDPQSGSKSADSRGGGDR
jgi:hypothetical protein